MSNYANKIIAIKNCVNHLDKARPGFLGIKSGSEVSDLYQKLDHGTLSNAPFMSEILRKYEQMIVADLKTELMKIACKMRESALKELINEMNQVSEIPETAQKAD